MNAGRENGILHISGSSCFPPICGHARFRMAVYPELAWTRATRAVSFARHVQMGKKEVFVFESVRVFASHSTLEPADT